MSRHDPLRVLQNICSMMPIESRSGSVTIHAMNVGDVKSSWTIESMVLWYREDPGVGDLVNGDTGPEGRHGQTTDNSGEGD